MPKRVGTAHRLDKYAIEDALRKSGYKCRHSFASDIKIYAMFAIALHRLAYISNTTVEHYHNCLEVALISALSGHAIRNDLLKRIERDGPIMRCDKCNAEFPSNAVIFAPQNVEQGKYPYHVNRPQKISRNPSDVNNHDTITCV